MTNELVVHDPKRVALSVSSTPLPPQRLLARAKERLAGRPPIATVTLGGGSGQKIARPLQPLSSSVKPLRLPTAPLIVSAPDSVSGSRPARIVRTDGSRQARTVSMESSRPTRWLTDLFGIRREKARVVQSKPVQAGVVELQRPRGLQRVQKPQRPKRELQTVSQPSALTRLDSFFAPLFSSPRKLVPVTVSASKVSGRIPRQARNDRGGRTTRPGNLVLLQPAEKKGEPGAVVPVGQGTGRQEGRARPAPVTVRVAGPAPGNDPAG